MKSLEPFLRKLQNEKTSKIAVLLELLILPCKGFTPNYRELMTPNKVVWKNRLIDGQTCRLIDQFLKSILMNLTDLKTPKSQKSGYTYCLPNTIHPLSRCKESNNRQFFVTRGYYFKMSGSHLKMSEKCNIFFFVFFKLIANLEYATINLNIYINLDFFIPHSRYCQTGVKKKF